MKITDKDVSRFWKHTDRRGDGECWPWVGAVGTSGYGVLMMRKDGGLRRAHRLSVEIAGTPIPAGRIVCHRCGNRRCVNPSHLYVGTYADNARDTVRQGRDAHARKTHCVNGHELAGDNIYVRTSASGGIWRQCRLCIVESNRRVRAANKSRRGRG